MWQIAGLLAVFLAIQAWRAADLPKGPAPPLRGALLAGGDFDLARAGKPILVHFWATWCPICKLEESSIAALARDYPVVSVALQSGAPEELRAYLAERGLDFPVIDDDDGRLARAWGVHGVPASLIIDRTGRIRFREVGYTSGLGLRFRLWWAARRPSVGSVAQSSPMTRSSRGAVSRVSASSALFANIIR